MKKTFLDDVETKIKPAAAPVKPDKSVTVRKVLIFVIVLAVYAAAMLLLFLGPKELKIPIFIFILVYSFGLVRPFIKLLRKLFKVPDTSGDA